ncbi:MAG: TIGR00725 family protein [Pseudomonadota bacterium]
MAHLLRHDGRLVWTPADDVSAALVLDPWSWVWAPRPDTGVLEGEPIATRAAVRWLHRNKQCRQVPVGVVGPRDPDGPTRATALALGRSLGDLGLSVLCGGKTGVMEAVAQGVKETGGTTIGIVPDNEWAAANRFIDIPLATGLGPARNVIVARASYALVAVGGQYGTITEVAYGLHFNRPVFGLSGAPDIDGVRHMESVDKVVDALAPIILRLPREVGL